MAQIDLHPFQTRQAIVHESKKHGMTMEVWSYVLHDRVYVLNLVLAGLGPARSRHALRSLGDQQGGEEIQQVACASALALLCAKGTLLFIQSDYD